MRPVPTAVQLTAAVLAAGSHSWLCEPGSAMPASPNFSLYVLAAVARYETASTPSRIRPTEGRMRTTEESSLACALAAMELAMPSTMRPVLNVELARSSARLTSVSRLESSEAQAVSETMSGLNMPRASSFESSPS